MPDPANLVATILYGVERNTGGQTVLMPGFGENSYVNPLSDRQIADIANYVLANYGNPDVAVTPQDVATARAGGPAPLLATLQPYMLPVVVVGALCILLLIDTTVGHRQRRAAVA